LEAESRTEVRGHEACLARDLVPGVPEDDEARPAQSQIAGAVALHGRCRRVGLAAVELTFGSGMEWRSHSAMNRSSNALSVCASRG
jgi:hypothetical protein